MIRINWCPVIVILSVLATANVDAQDDDSAKKESKPATSAEKSVGNAASGKKLKSKLDDELLRNLTNSKDDADATAENQIEQLIRSMRDVQAKIEQQETGKPTQQQQQEIVEQIEDLIKAAEQSQSSSSRSQQSKQKKPRKPRKKGQQSPKSKSGESAGQDNKKNPQNSEARVHKAKEKAISDAKQKVLIQEVWGHLPPTLRKKLLNVFSEKRLLKYDDLVRRYFESLTENNDGLNRK